jgi:hypothetical protein
VSIEQCAIAPSSPGAMRLAMLLWVKLNGLGHCPDGGFVYVTPTWQYPTAIGRRRGLWRSWVYSCPKPQTDCCWYGPRQLVP